MPLLRFPLLPQLPQRMRKGLMRVSAASNLASQRRALPSFLEVDRKKEGPSAGDSQCWPKPCGRAVPVQTLWERSAHWMMQMTFPKCGKYVYYHFRQFCTNVRLLRMHLMHLWNIMYYSVSKHVKCFFSPMGLLSRWRTSITYSLIKSLFMYLI